MARRRNTDKDKNGQRILASAPQQFLASSPQRVMASTSQRPMASTGPTRPTAPIAPSAPSRSGPIRPYQGPPAPIRSAGRSGSPSMAARWQEERYAPFLGARQAELDVPIDVGDEMGLDDIINLLGGGGGGGGGGRPVNPDPLGWNAIAREQALREAYANMGGAIDTGAQAELDALTGRRTQTTQAGADARQRLNQAITDLNTISGQTAGAVGQAYGAAGANIDQVLAQYAAQQQALGQGAQRTLGAFGVGPEELGVMGPSLQQQLGTYRGALGALGGVAQADLAQRPQAYAGLSADTMARLSAQEQQALAEIAAQEASIKSQQARDRAQLGLQMYPQLFGIQDAEIARRQGYA